MAVARKLLAVARKLLAVARKEMVQESLRLLSIQLGLIAVGLRFFVLANQRLPTRSFSSSMARLVMIVRWEGFDIAIVIKPKEDNTKEAEFRKLSLITT